MNRRSSWHEQALASVRFVEPSFKGHVVRWQWVRRPVAERKCLTDCKTRRGKALISSGAPSSLWFLGGVGWFMQLAKEKLVNVAFQQTR